MAEGGTDTPADTGGTGAGADHASVEDAPQGLARSAPCVVWATLSLEVCIGNGF